MAPQPDQSDTRLVYCRRCLKTHAVRPGEVECGGPGAWIYEDTGLRYGASDEEQRLCASDEEA